uniref:Uncharacterized protein n=1 Tax=Anguilla anguilla TaxID=7936 RepID=A0A0E9QDH6_ANGAN
MICNLAENTTLTNWSQYTVSRGAKRKSRLN